MGPHLGSDRDENDHHHHGTINHGYVLGWFSKNQSEFKEWSWLKLWKVQTCEATDLPTFHENQHPSSREIQDHHRLEVKICLGTWKVEIGDVYKSIYIYMKEKLVLFKLLHYSTPNKHVRYPSWVFFLILLNLCKFWYSQSHDASGTLRFAQTDVRSLNYVRH